MKGRLQRAFRSEPTPNHLIVEPDSRAQAGELVGSQIDVVRLPQRRAEQRSTERVRPRNTSTRFKVSALNSRPREGCSVCWSWPAAHNKATHSDTQSEPATAHRTLPTARRTHLVLGLVSGRQRVVLLSLPASPHRPCINNQHSKRA